MANDQDSTSLVAIQATLERMEQQLSEVCSDVKDLKQSGKKAAQLPAYTNTGMVQSTPVQSATLMPINSGPLETTPDLKTGKRRQQQRQSGFFQAPPPCIMFSGGQVLHASKTSGQSAILQKDAEKGTTTVKEMTRSVQCTHSFYNKRMCEPYNHAPDTTGLHKDTDSTAVKSSGRQVVSIINELEGVNNRQMGIRNSKRFPDSFHKPASSRSQVKPSYLLNRVKPAGTEGSRHPDREGCCHPATQPSTSRGFLFHFFLVPKKEGQMRPLFQHPRYLIHKLLVFR